jgi:hydroxypyruvate reductase
VEWRSNGELKTEARAIFDAGVAAVDPYHAVRACLWVEAGDLVLLDEDGSRQRFKLGDFARIRVLGAGKASARMALALEDILGERIERGLVTVKTGHTAKLKRVTLVEASHPVPDLAGLAGTRAQLELVEDLGEGDLVLAVLSGGGSALLPLPAEGITLAEKQELTSFLLGAGATIHEINGVRKHISAVKGGQLARAVAPATLISLILSDVVGDGLDSIASGPTVPDSSSYSEARKTLLKYQLWMGAPTSIRERLEAGCRGEIPETPGPEDKVFSRGFFCLVASSGIALNACEREAKARGWNTLVLSSCLQGEAREVARVLAGIVLELRRHGRPVALPACVLCGGETTVTLRGEGKGGRNQELALAACLDLAGEEGVLLFSGGTDGNDGPTDAAGGVALGDSLVRAKALGLDVQEFLARNDAYHLLEELGDLVKTGPTGTNVMDLQILLVDA